MDVSKAGSTGQWDFSSAYRLCLPRPNARGYWGSIPSILVAWWLKSSPPALGAVSRPRDGSPGWGSWHHWWQWMDRARPWSPIRNITRQHISILLARSQNKNQAIHLQCPSMALVSAMRSNHRPYASPAPLNLAQYSPYDNS